MAKEGHNGQVGLPTAGRGDVGSEFGGGVDICPSFPEYCSTVYRESTNTEFISGCRATYGGGGDPTVMGAGRPKIRIRYWKGSSF